MNIHRAKEVAESSEMKNVTYNNRQVYIQHVNEDTGMARVFYLDETENEFDVDVNTLLENNLT